MRWRLAALPLRWQALAEQQSNTEQRSKREAGTDPCRRLDIGGLRIIARKKPAERRADDEAEAEGGPDKPHPLGSVFWLCNIGDIGVRRSDVPGACARQRARRVEHPQRRRAADPKIRQ